VNIAQSVAGEESLWAGPTQKKTAQKKTAQKKWRMGREPLSAILDKITMLTTLTT